MDLEVRNINQENMYLENKLKTQVIENEFLNIKTIVKIQLEANKVAMT